MRAGLLNSQQGVGLCGRYALRMPHLLRVRELLDLRVAAQRARRAGRTRQRFLKPGVLLARLLQMLVVVEGERAAKQNEQYDRAGDKSARHNAPSVTSGACRCIDRAATTQNG